jgi:hypothetical protein
VIGSVVSKKTRDPEHLRSPENRTRPPTGDGFSGPHSNGADRDGYGERQLRVAALGAFAAKTAMVVERLGQITGYASDIGFAGHAVAETNQDLKVLIGAAPAFPGPGFLLPTRNHDVFAWSVYSRSPPLVQWYCCKSTCSALPSYDSKVIPQGPFTWIE